MLDRYYWIPPILTNVVKNVVDLGAKTGAAALSLAAQFPKARLICLEPNRSDAQVLAKNLAWLGDRAHIAQADFGDPDRCLDMLLDASGISEADVLKVDLEGAECSLFMSRGSWWSRVRLVIAPLHEPYGFKDFEKDMEAIGFRAVPGGFGYGNILPVAIRR